MNMGNLFRLSTAETRSISPENLTGEKGKGGMATLEEGVHGKQARELGHQFGSLLVPDGTPPGFP